MIELLIIFNCAFPIVISIFILLIRNAFTMVGFECIFAIPILSPVDIFEKCLSDKTV